MGGRRSVAEIAAVPGRCEDGVIEIESIFRTERGALVRGEGFPPHPERFVRAGIDLPFEVGVPSALGGHDPRAAARLTLYYGLALDS